MARDNIAFLVNLRKNENTESKGYGCYYCEAEKKEPMNLKGFARHLAEHGKLASYEMLVLVLQNVVDCMTHLVATGQPVKLDGLGTFYPTIEGKPATSVEKGVEQMNENIVGVHLRFRPEGAKGEESDQPHAEGEVHLPGLPADQDQVQDHRRQAQGLPGAHSARHLRRRSL